MDEQVSVFPYGVGGSLPLQQKSDRADLLDKIKPEHIVEVIRHRLLGEEYREGNWISIPALKDVSLSEVGAWKIANLMLGVGSINISISKFKENEIKLRAHNLSRRALKDMLYHWKEYGVKSASTYGYVHQIIFSNTYAVLKQADEASIQELMKATIQENRNVNQQPQKEGKISRIKRAIFGQ